MARQRVDLLLVARGLAPTRQKARALLMSGAVLVDEKPVSKAGQLVSPEAALRLRGRPMPYVSRGGLKLEHALDTFPVPVAGCVAVDVGISTGGFTDCLLQRQAARVYGIDVGRGQVAWRVRQDPAVVLFEGTNIRHVEPSLLAEPADLAVVDVSFISLTLVLPVVARLLRVGGHALPLVKPQFEVGRDRVGRKGVVRDEARRLEAVEKIASCAGEIGFRELGRTQSPVPGPKGNLEYFLYLKKVGSAVDNS